MFLLEERKLAVVLIVFGSCAVLLAGIGLYGVIAYAVQQRAYEIAIRLAIGARWYDIRNMVLFDGLKLASCGVAIGISVRRLRSSGR